MAIKNLFSAGYAHPTCPPQESNAAVASDVTLAFAFDSGYLIPFKVLIYSLCRQGSLLDCPVAIYSDDPTVFDDPVVKLVTDKPRLLHDSQREELHELARTRVKRPERGDWNRGTFLKWAIFEEQSTPRLLFLDVDMLCLGPMEPLLAAPQNVDLIVAPQFQRTIEKGGSKGTKRRTAGAVESILLDLMQGKYSGGHCTHINSGMMLINSSLLSTAFYKHLVAWSHREVLTNEQRHLSSVMASEGYSFNMVPVTYNFQERYLAHLPGTKGMRALDAIKILHFAGQEKPWKDGPHRMRQSQGVWFRHFYDMQSDTRLLDDKKVLSSARFVADYKRPAAQAPASAETPEAQAPAAPAVPAVPAPEAPAAQAPTTPKPKRPFASERYWEERYAGGGNSGKGSYGDFADFKAEVLNNFVAEHAIQDVLELGSGDGNQLSLSNYPKYYGYDVSTTAIETCRSRFKDDPTKTFNRLSDLKQQQADLALSLDVIYHLIEDAIFAQHMRQLFGAAKRFVIIYASNFDSSKNGDKAVHVRHRKFTDWVQENEPRWQLIEELENRTTSPANFFIYQRRASPA